MPVGQWKTLTIRGELKDRLQKSFESDDKKYQKQSFSSWFENLLWEIVDYDEAVREYGKLLEPVSYDDKHVIIMDHWKGKHYFVQISASEKVALYCQEDKSQTCMHVGFCLALPRIYKALIKKGYRPPHFHVKNHRAAEILYETERSLRDKDRQRRRARRRQGWSEEDIRKEEEKTVESVEDFRDQLLGEGP